MNRLASIDIGSQTIRLLVAECGACGTMLPVYREREIIRLGEGMHSAKFLKAESIQRAVKCITRFALLAREYSAAEVHATATACVRNAENASEFTNAVYKATGLVLRVLSGEEEAQLSFKGVRSVFSSTTGQFLIVDVGGGSTEFILLENDKIIFTESINLGVIGLAEKHLLHDPPLPSEIRSLSDDVSYILKNSLTVLPLIKSAPELAGTAGTVTTLAAMDLKMTDYNPDKINAHVLRRKSIENLLTAMIDAPLHIRSSMQGLEKGRAVVIIPGTVIVLAVMDLFSCSTMLVSDSGLLEGIILDKIADKYSSNKTVHSHSPFMR